MFEVGDKVKLSSLGMQRYKDESNNPHGGTGVVAGTSNSDQWPWVDVEWYNGTTNDYLAEELVPADMKEKPCIEDAIKVWDGKPETLEVGMHVKDVKDITWLVKYIYTARDKCVVSLGDRETARTISGLKAVLPSNRDTFKIDVLTAWKNQSLDNAYDTLDTSVHIDSLLEVIWELHSEKLCGAEV